MAIASVARDVLRAAPLKRSAWLVLLAVMGLGLSLRLVALPQAILPSGVLVQDPDSCYHLRRARLILQQYPGVPSVDRFLGYPEGGECPWPPLYDLLLATAALPLGADGQALEWLAIVLPPVLGTAHVGVAFLLGRRLWGVQAGLMAALLVAVMPAAVAATAPGNVDHHGAMVLVESSAVLIALWCARRRGLVPVVLLALLLAMGMLTFLGLLLFLPLLAGWMLWRGGRGALSAHAGTTFVLAALLVAAFTAGRRGLELVTLSWAHPLLLLWPGLLLLAQARWRRKLGVYLAALACGWALAAAPGIRGALLWALRNETFMEVVAESRSLLRGQDGSFSLAGAVAALSPGFLAVPVLGPWLAVRRREADSVVVAAWALLYLALALRQGRFAISATTGIALVTTWGVDNVIRWSRERRLGWFAMAGVAAVLLLPPLRIQWVLGRSVLRWAVTGRRTFSVDQLQRVQAAAALRWLREHSPPASTDPFGDTEPAYGVLSGWGYGHLILYHAQRPAMATNFGTYVAPGVCRRATALLVGGATDASSRALDSLRVRYIVVTSRLVGSLSDHARLAGTELPQFPEDRLAWRLLVQNGSGPARGAAPRARLVREAGRQAVKIFEVVRGAQLLGQAGPGEPVEAVLHIQVLGTRAFVWNQTTRCDAGGAFRLIVPYSTGTRVGDVVVEEAYHVSAGGRDFRVSVTESQVQQGEVLVLQAP